MWVVKIGGSLLGSLELEHWLALIAKYSNGKIIIVPGGGIFANAVRDAQKISNISDTCAHRLALLAMDQFGLLLASMNSDLALARSECEIDEQLWQHRGIIWLPSQMVLSDDKVPENWNVTSDSIAAWLAEKLGAQQLVLLKSDKPNKSKLSLKLMSKRGIIDQGFSDFVLNKTFNSWVVKKTDFEYFLKGVDDNILSKVGSSLYQPL